MAALDAGLLRTVWRELTHRTGFERVPEPDLVMTDAASVDAYTRAGRSDGALAGSYLHHVAHISEVIRPGETVLDVACGPATLLGQVAALNPDVRFIGTDVSQPMLARARGILDEDGLLNVELRVDDMTRLETIGNRAVDAVLSTMSLHHLPDLEAFDRALAALARVLKPGGGVYLCDFGRLKSLASVDYFVRRAAEAESPAFVQDYAQSLRAAFGRRDFVAAARRHLGDRVCVYATAISPLLVVVKSARRRSIEHLKPRLQAIARALPPARRRDLAQMIFFLRLGGLRSAL